MKYNSNEIETVLFNKQMSLYTKIENLINQRFNELDPDMLSVLTRTLMDLEDRIQLYKKNLKHGELFGVTYHNNRKKKKFEGISLMEIFNTI